MTPLSNNDTRLRRIYHNMKTRCTNPNYDKFPRYGGRGISLCDEWTKSFKAFEAWALENGYTDELTLERINNDGNYCPENCIWVSIKDQANNRHTNNLITHAGKTQSITLWAEELGINPGTLYQRIETYKWPIEKAFYEPVNTQFRHVRPPQKRIGVSISKLAREHGLNRSTLRTRLEHGWTLEQALNTPARQTNKTV